MAKNIRLNEDDLEVRSDRAGEETVVAEAQVPKGKVWGITDQPVTVALTKFAGTVDAVGGETTTIDFAEEFNFSRVPRVAYMDDIVDLEPGDELNEKTDLNVVVQSVDDTTTVFFGAEYDDDDVMSIEVEAVEDTELEVYVVAREGVARFQKRAASTSGTTETIDQYSLRSLAYSDPDNPDADTGIYLRAEGDLSQILPPKFQFEIVYYDDSRTVHLPETEELNLHIDVPLRQRSLRGSESASELRRRVEDDMTDSHRL